MKKFTALALIATLTFLSACNTVGGVARDTYGAGRFVVNQLTDDD